MVWNGTTWDRARSASADGLAAPGMPAAGLMVLGGGNVWNRVGTPALAGDANNGQTTANVGPMGFNGTTYDRLRTGSPTADPGATGVLAAQMHVSDGTTTRRLFAPGGIGDANGMVNGLVSGGYAFNGTNWDRIRNASAATQSAATQVGILATANVGNWSAIHVPATATQATATRSAGGAGIRHVCTSITATLSAGTLALAAGAPLVVSLIDGASGGTTYLWRSIIDIPAVAGQAYTIALSGLSLFGTAATAMTFEFSAAGGTNSFQSVCFTGYDVS
jgi:hypothetical protein